MDLTDLLIGGVVGVTASVLARLMIERFRRSPNAPNSGAAGDGEAATPAALDSNPRVDQPEGVVPEEPKALAMPEVGRTDPSPVRSSERVIIHLYRSGRPDLSGVLSARFTQGGMREELHASQSALTRTLSRLQAAGVLSVERRHIAGESRRLKVYLLTPLGESLARSLERKRREKESDAGPPG